MSQREMEACQRGASPVTCQALQIMLDSVRDRMYIAVVAGMVPGQNQGRANMGREYISVTDTAKMLREALKRHFADIKFSVRSSSYAGGASIRVHWNNGPSSAMVDRIAQRFAGAEFDGMIDLKTSHTDILVGADGAMREVRFGADYVFCQRQTSDALLPACAAEYAKTCVCESRQDQNSRDYWINHALAEIAIPASEPVEETAQRVVRQIFKTHEVQS